MTIAGIDGCKGGWLCIEELDDGLRAFIAKFKDGPDGEAIEAGENREKFKEIVAEIDRAGLAAESARSAICHSMDDCLAAVEELGYPVVVRPSFTMGGTLATNDVVTVGATGVFSDENVGTGKTVTLTSSYGGADRNNY